MKCGLVSDVYCLKSSSLKCLCDFQLLQSDPSKTPNKKPLVTYTLQHVEILLSDIPSC